ncbi:MAG: hypothetical protein J6T56_07185 [Bacteroidales bacterium]|nr:hypothetical protein [Bacteroidales bacterium]
MDKILKKLPIVATVALLVAGAFLFAGCEKEKKTENDITNIKWHLTKFVDVANKTEEAPYPNSSDVYWLKLKINSFEGKSCANVLMGTVKVDAVTEKITFSNIGGTEIGEPFDGQRFIDCLKQVHNFKKTTENTLILYYDNNKKYMQFEKLNEP